VVPVRNCVPTVVAEAVRRQPLTQAKLTFCWTLSVGPAIDRATRATLTASGTIVVEVHDAHWKREVERALPIVSNRLRYLLGEDAVAGMTVRDRSRQP
jgi:hypothetical protein